MRSRVGRTLLRTRFQLFGWIFFAILLALADDGSGAGAFCERARSDFNGLLRLCKTERADYWRQRSNDAVERSLAKSKELQATSEMLGRQPNGKQLQQVFAFDYLNDIREFELNETTALIEDLGRELLNDRIASQLMPKITNIEQQFTSLRGKPSTESVQRSYIAFLQLRRSVATLETDAPVKYAFSFQPKADAYASEPIKTIVYTIHDWNAAFAKVDEITQQLLPIQDSIQTARFFIPKDPLPWLPLITQTTFLMVAMAGWIRTYHSDKAFVTIGSLVITSMLLSVFLVFYSDETLLNILRQSILPGLFIMYWIAKSKNWLPRMKRNNN
jgi:hypothetical protein